MKAVICRLLAGVMCGAGLVVGGCGGGDGGDGAVGGTVFYVHNAVDSNAKWLSTEPFWAEEVFSVHGWAGSGNRANDWAITLSGDIPGTVYGYHLWANSVGSSFRVEIILKRGSSETVLVRWDGVVAPNPEGIENYSFMEGSAVGPDLAEAAGDQLILRVTNTGEEYVYIAAGCDEPQDQSYITIDQ